MFKRIRNYLSKIYLRFFYLMKYPEEIPYLHPQLKNTEQGYYLGQKYHKKIIAQQTNKPALAIPDPWRSALQGSDKIHIIIPPTIGWLECKRRIHHFAHHLAKAKNCICWFGIPRREWPQIRRCYSVSDSQDLIHVEDRLFLIKEPNRLLSILDERNVWFYIRSPLLKPYLQSIENPRYIYDIHDHPRLNSFYGKAYEMDDLELIRKAAIVVISAESLRKFTESIRKDVLLVPNGVDIGDFNPDIHTARPVYQEMSIKNGHFKYIAGYVGALGPWLDWDLLADCAQAYPDILFMLIGPLIGDDSSTTINYPQSHITPNVLFRYPNIRWLRTIPYASVPPYLQACAITLIPFKVNEITHAVSPVKLFEYAGMGKPIVATGLQEIIRENIGIICKTKEEYVHAIFRACQLSHDAKYRENLRKTIQSRTWEIRFQPLIRQIQQLSTS